MEYSPRLPGDGPAPAPHAPMLRIRDDWNIPPALQRDLAVARHSRSNLLLVGTERQLVGLVRFLVRDLNEAVILWCQETELLLPPASSRIATLVVRDVDALMPDEQRRLCEWLESCGKRVQVVSTASAPLVTQVETRAFSDDLYYRLNTIYVDLSK